MVQKARIIGVPGAGKTRYMIRQVIKDLSIYAPAQIGVVSLTTTATQEAKDRIIEETGIDNQFNNIRTIHSHCFKSLGLEKGLISDTPAMIREFSEDAPEFEFSSTNLGTLEDGPTDTAKRNRIEQNTDKFRRMQYYRNRMIPTSEWDRDVIPFYETWMEWNEQLGMVDFTGMLEETLKYKLCPNIDVLYVDEAQDQSPLASAVTQMWGERCQKFVVLGDPDQAIFEFAGAEPKIMIDLDVDFEKVLDQSYRMSPAVNNYAMRTINKSVGRRQIDCKPFLSRGKGNVFECREPSIKELVSAPSTAILTRCNYQTKQWAEWLLKNQIPFSNTWRPGESLWNPCSTKSWKAAQTYFRITRHKDVIVPSTLGVSSSEIKNMASMCIAKTACPGNKTWIKNYRFRRGELIHYEDLRELGFTKEFYDRELPLEELFKFSGKAAQLIYDLAKTNELILLQKPTVTLGTIHSVKGGQFSTVYIDNRLSRRIWESVLHDKNKIANQSVEVRVAYVGVSRAQENLGIMRLENNPFYDRA